MTTVAISYRQPDNAAWGGRLADQLRRVLVTDQVFIADSASVEHPGRLPDAPLALVVIGPGWSGLHEPSGRRLIDDPTDPVRLEVQGVLAGSGRVVPVLVGGEEMPTEDQLPEVLRPLAALAPVELSDEHFREDVDRLSLTVLAVGRDVRRREESAEERMVRAWAVVLFVVCCTAGMFLTPFPLIAMVVCIRLRLGVRRAGGTRGLVLANLGFGYALFCLGINLLWLGGYLS